MNKIDVYHKIDGIILQKTNKRNVHLFGAGTMMKEFVFYSRLDFSSCIFDNDEKKQGIKFKKENGDMIVVKIPTGAEMISFCNDFFLIASSNENEIRFQLKQYGCENVLSLSLLKEQVCDEENVKSNFVQTVMIESTNICNARCFFCANPTMKRVKQHMPQEIFNKIINRLSTEDIYPDTFRLHCCGEPMLDPDLFKKIEGLKRQFPNSVVGYTTNFSLADKNMVRKIFESGQDYIVISLNSSDADEYEKIMGLKYNTTINNVRHFIDCNKENGFVIDITLSIVESKNKKSVEQFCDYWKNYSKDTVKVRVIKESSWTKAGMKNDFKKVDKFIHPCNMLTKEVTILSDGRYGICCFDGEGNMGDLNINDHSIREYIQSIKKAQMREEMYDGNCPNMCLGCSMIGGI